MANIYCPNANTANSAATYVTQTTRPSDPFGTPSSLTWTLVEASAAEDWAGMLCTSAATNDATEEGFWLLAKGAAGSETIIASWPDRVSGRGGIQQIYVPIPVASGTRISAAFAAADGAGSSSLIGISAVKASLYDQVPTWTVMDSGPYDLTDDPLLYGNHPTIDPGATANTLSAWTEMSLTTGNSANNVLNGDSLSYNYDHFGWMIMDNENSSMATKRSLCDLRVDNGTTPVTLFEQHLAFADGTECRYTGPLWSPEGASSGDAVDVRMQTDETDAIDRITSFVFFGLR